MNINTLYIFLISITLSCSSNDSLNNKEIELSEFDYKTLNQTIFSDKECFNIFKTTIPIISGDCVMVFHNFNQMLLDSTVYLIDCDKVKKGINCVEQFEFDSIMSLEEGLIQRDSVTLVIDRWNEFNRKFGGKGIHSVSKPMYDKDTSFVVINHYFIGGNSFEIRELLLYEKIEGEWIFRPDSSSLI